MNFDEQLKVIDNYKNDLTAYMIENPVPRANLNFVDCPKEAINPCYAKVECKEDNKPNNKKGKTMMNFDNESVEMNTIDYLGNRAYGIFHVKDEELQRQFGLIDDPEPRTFEEALARLTSGKYQIAKDNLDKRTWGYDYMRFIRWRDPSVKEDRAGYEAANKKLQAAKTSAEDTMVLFTSDPAKQLEALKAFESTTIN